MTFKKKHFIEIDALDWCNKERLLSLDNSFAQSSSLLSWSGLLSKVLHAWVKNELLHELIEGEALHEALSDTKLADKALQAWGFEVWGHRLESIYLAQKSNLDRITLSMIRVKDQHLAFEIYHRLKANESTFDELSWTYGEGTEKRQGGRYINQRISSIPTALHPLVRKVKSGEVLKPHRLADWYVVLTLEELIPAQFDSDTQALLIKGERNLWMNNVVEYLAGHLESQ